MNKIKIGLIGLAVIVILLGISAIDRASPAIDTPLGGRSLRVEFSAENLGFSSTTLVAGTRTLVLPSASSTGYYLHLENASNSLVSCVLANASTTVSAGFVLQGTTSTNNGVKSKEFFGYKGDVWCISHDYPENEGGSEQGTINFGFSK